MRPFRSLCVSLCKHSGRWIETHNEEVHHEHQQAGRISRAAVRSTEDRNRPTRQDAVDDKRGIGVLPAGRTGVVLRAVGENVVLWDSQLGELRLQVIRRRRDGAAAAQPRHVAFRCPSRWCGSRIRWSPGRAFVRYSAACSSGQDCIDVHQYICYTPFTFSVYIEGFQLESHDYRK